MSALPAADAPVAGAGVVTGGWVAAAGLAAGPGGGNADRDAAGELAGPADPDAPGVSRKMPSPASATTIRAKAPLRWPGVGSMALRYFWRRIGRSQNGPGGAGLSPASLLPANGPVPAPAPRACCCPARSEEHTSELQSRRDLVCRLLLEKKKKKARPRLLLYKKKKK